MKTNNDLTVACYYFPNYHPSDVRNRKLKGEGWTEWKLVKEAQARFKGHRQPVTPLWGYTDESDPKVMAQKIDAATNHGIDAFIFDWYWYNDGPFLERALDNGFLGASNNNRLKFALMWANHDWLDIHPYKRDTPHKILYPGKVTEETYNQICDLVIERYFSHPSYWLIDGAPYFSIYELNKFLEIFGSMESARSALDRFRKKVKTAGFPDIHLNAVVWENPVLPGETTTMDIGKCIRTLGFDSVTSYVWVHHVKLPDQRTEYQYAQKQYFEYWEKAEKLFDVPYYPNITMGWDSSPRANQDDQFGNFGYPFCNTITNNTPEAFKGTLFAMKERLLRNGGPSILNINSWNEWTEGSYLEPDTVTGMGYLEAVRDMTS